MTNQINGATFWTSAWDWLSLLNPAAGPAHRPALSFIVGLDSGPKPPDIYCRKEDRSLASWQFGAESPQVVEDLFSLYFRDRYDDLYQQLFMLSTIDSADE